MMAAVAIVVNEGSDDAQAVARRCITWCEQRGIAVRLQKDDASLLGRDELGVVDEDLSEGVDVALSLGGDGCMLRTVGLVQAELVPVIGVNAGSLGYLTEVEPANAEAALERFLAGDCTIDDRMMVAADIRLGPHREQAVGLNEIVVEKTPEHHVVRLGVAINGHPFTTYVADGLIVASPTGSTAYAFSARGPIVSPRHSALLVTPVAPHMLFDRTLVLAPDDHVELEVLGDRPAFVAADGRAAGLLHPGDSVVCTAAERPARLVRFGTREFHHVLTEKFGLSDR